MSSPSVVPPSSIPSSSGPPSAPPPPAAQAGWQSSPSTACTPSSSPSSSSSSCPSSSSIPLSGSGTAAPQLLAGPETLLEPHPPSLPASRQLFYAARTPFCLLSFTLPAERAVAVAEQLVLLGLVSKVSVFADTLTVFRRHGAVYRNTEQQLLVRTRHALVDRVREAVAALSKLDCGWDLTEAAVSGGDRLSIGRMDDSTCSIDEAAAGKERRKRLSSALAALAPAAAPPSSSRRSLALALSKDVSKLESLREPPSARKCWKHRRWRKQCPASCPFKPALSRPEMEATRDEPVMATHYSEPAGSIDWEH